MAVRGSRSKGNGGKQESNDQIKSRKNMQFLLIE